MKFSKLGIITTAISMIGVIFTAIADEKREQQLEEMEDRVDAKINELKAATADTTEEES